MSVNNFVVNYRINVDSQSAINNIAAFQRTISSLTKSTTELNSFAANVKKITGELGAAFKNMPVLNLGTTQVINDLKQIKTLITSIRQSAAKPVTIKVQQTTSNNATNIVSASRGSSSSTKPLLTRGIPGNIAYRNLGPTTFDSNGIGVFDMLKGMGLAYGITGLMSLMTGTLKEATDYNNLIKTTYNILKTHDKQPNFEGRFKEMERTIRNVGIETKYTAPQVADASRFLAMAGFNLDEINHSIAPIADIALVGDTDLGETADVVTNIMTGYGIRADKVRKAADIMTMTFTKSNTTLTEIAESYKYSASLLAAAGVPFEEATAAIGILGDAGIKASQAGTTLRTIVANIVKPTKKQAKVWKDIGVRRFDDNGNLRPISEIFSDLNSADLDVADYYGIFHKTAAQGAVSLAKGVDKWNEIIRVNFLSDGVTKRLAEEKKNTIQGLWYQMTSTLTETAMKVFEDMEGSIRQFLKNMTNWLGSPSALKAFKDFSAIIYDMLSVLKDFSIWAVKAYNALSGFIKPWLKLQLYLWPIMSTLRAFSAIINILNGARGVAFTLIKIAGGFWAIAKSLGAIKTIVAGGVLQKLISALTLPFVLGSRGTYRKLIAGGYVDTGSNTGGVGGGNIGGSVNNKALLFGGLGAIGGGVLGSTIGEQIGGTAGSWIGGIGGAVLGGWGIKALAGISTVAGGVVAAVLGVGAAITSAYFEMQNYWKGVTEGFDKLNEKLFKTKGYMSEGISITDKYLQLAYDKQLDLNTKVSEYIRLRREELGLENDAVKNASGKTLREMSPDIAKNIEDLPWYWWLTPNQNSAGLKRAFSSLGVNLLDFDKKTYDLYKSTLANADTKTKFALHGLYSTAYDHPLAHSIIEEFTTMLKQNPSDYENIKSLLENRLLQLSNQVKWFSSNYNNYSDVLNLTDEQILQDPIAYTFFKMRILQELGLSSVNNTPSGKALQSLIGLSGLTQLTEAQQADFLFKNGIGFFASSVNAPYGSTAFWKARGYDLANNQFVQYGSHLSKYWAESASGSFSAAAELIATLPETYQKLFTILSSTPALKAFESTSVTGGKPEIGQQKMIGGKWYEYKIKTPNTQPTWVPIETPSNLLGTDDFSNEYSNDDYKPRYTSSTAAPKQVIVKIENLMNVESIDMTDSRNVAVINNLKEQMAQALIDVVHDFDMTYQE